MKSLVYALLISCIALNTTNAQLSKLKSKAKQLTQNSIPNSISQNPDQGYTSRAHESNAGKIVFAKSLNDIQFRNEKSSNFTNSFKASEPIYARLYLHQSIGNTSHQGEKTYKSILMYDLYINGNKVPFKKAFGMYRHVPENERTFYMEDVGDNDQLNVWTSWRPTLLPLESDEELKYGNVNIMARCFVLSLIDLPAGKHDIELKMYSRDLATGAETDILAEGSFTLMMTDNDKKKLMWKYTPPLPKDEWRGGNKKALLADIKLAFEKQLRKKPILTGISGIDWNEGTYTLTGMKYKKVSGWAVFEDSDGDGQVPITTFNFISDYSNGGWTKLRFDSHCLGCPDWDVEVDAVKAMAANN